VGHAGSDVTTRVYGHRSQGRDRGAAEQIAAVIFGPEWRMPEAADSAEPDDGAEGTDRK
jgi:hypothetical protein